MAFKLLACVLAPARAPASAAFAVSVLVKDILPRLTVTIKVINKITITAIIKGAIWPFFLFLQKRIISISNSSCVSQAPQQIIALLHPLTAGLFVFFPGPGRASAGPGRASAGPG